MKNRKPLSWRHIHKQHWFYSPFYQCHNIKSHVTTTNKMERFVVVNFLDGKEMVMFLEQSITDSIYDGKLLSSWYTFIRLYSLLLNDLIFEIAVDRARCMNVWTLTVRIHHSEAYGYAYIRYYLCSQRTAVGW